MSAYKEYIDGILIVNSEKQNANTTKEESNFSISSEQNTESGKLYHLKTNEKQRFNLSVSAVSPSIVDVDKDFITIKGIASSNSVDHYGTEMSYRALKKMEAQVKEGVVILPRHESFSGAGLGEWDEVIGKTVSGKVLSSTIESPAEPNMSGFVLEVESRLYTDDERTKDLLKRLERGQEIGQSIGGWFENVLVQESEDGQVERMIVEDVTLDHIAITRAPANPDSQGLAILNLRSIQSFLDRRKLMNKELQTKELGSDSVKEEIQTRGVDINPPLPEGYIPEAPESKPLPSEASAGEEAVEEGEERLDHVPEMLDMYDDMKAKYLVMMEEMEKALERMKGMEEKAMHEKAMHEKAMHDDMKEKAMHDDMDEKAMHDDMDEKAMHDKEKKAMQELMKEMEDYKKLFEKMKEYEALFERKFYEKDMHGEDKEERIDHEDGAMADDQDHIAALEKDEDEDASDLEKDELSKRKAMPYISEIPLADEDVPWGWNTTTQDEVLGEGLDNWERYRSAHLFMDEQANPETKRAYKLPIARMINGELRIVLRGVIAAMAALNGARGGVNIPDSDRTPIYRNIQKYMKRFGREAPPLRSQISNLEEIQQDTVLKLDNNNNINHDSNDNENSTRSTTMSPEEMAKMIAEITRSVVNEIKDNNVQQTEMEIRKTKLDAAYGVKEPTVEELRARLEKAEATLSEVLEMPLRRGRHTSTQVRGIGSQNAFDHMVNETAGQGCVSFAAIANESRSHLLREGDTSQSNTLSNHQLKDMLAKGLRAAYVDGLLGTPVAGWE